jgi:sugar-specific transcriptional regulator TrmB
MSQKDKLNELQDRLGEIFNGIDDYYSQSILDELINRIENTIDDFNKEFQSLVGNLKVKQKRRTPTKTTRKTSAASRSKSKT